MGQDASRPVPQGLKQVQYGKVFQRRNGTLKVEEEWSWVLQIHRNNSFTLTQKTNVLRSLLLADALGDADPNGANALTDADRTKLETVLEIVYYGNANSVSVVAPEEYAGDGAFKYLQDMVKREEERRLAEKRGEYSLETMQRLQLVLRTSRAEFKYKGLPKLMTTVQQDGAVQMQENERGEDDDEAKQPNEDDAKEESRLADAARDVPSEDVESVQSSGEASYSRGQTAILSPGSTSSDTAIVQRWVWKYFDGIIDETNEAPSDNQHRVWQEAKIKRTDPDFVTTAGCLSFKAELPPRSDQLNLSVYRLRIEPPSDTSVPDASGKIGANVKLALGTPEIVQLNRFGPHVQPAKTGIVAPK